MSEWVEQEMATADLGDRRLEKRMKKILDQFSEDPQASPNAALRGWGEASAVLGKITVDVKAREQNKKVSGGSRIKKKRLARVATLEVRSTKVTLRPPFRKERELEPVSFWVVQAKEASPPENDDPIEWILLTSIAAEGFQGAVEIVELYRARWEIEVFHRVLKSGCTVEELELKDDNRIKVAITLYLIVTWRVLYVMRLGRECPVLPCNLVFEEDEWKALYFVEYGPTALTTPPPLKDFIRTLAKHGGFNGRKSDGEPGPESISKGLMRLEGMVVFRQVLLTHQPSLRAVVG